MGGLAIIPARGGSKGVPRKNVRMLCGKPLIAWTIEAAREAVTIDRVVVSTDDAEIAQVSRKFDAEVVWRPRELSEDTASSEAVLLHAIRQLAVSRGTLAFLQCTSPLMLPEDIDGTVSLLHEVDSAFTGTIWHHFIWKQMANGLQAIGHDKRYRPTRQQKETEFLEVGAVYAMRIEDFVSAQHRFIGESAVYPIPNDRGLEIDSESDFVIAEALLRQRLQSNRAAHLPPLVRALVVDCDGVLTNNRVHVDQTGVESITFHRGDGWSLERLQERGIRCLVLTAEKNPTVRHRCDKLGVECIVAEEKLPALNAWLNKNKIDPGDTLYVGNDIPDIPCMHFVGCGIAPADAEHAAKNAARIVLDKPGGHGCIRELTDLLFNNGHMD